jgi:hypothetical protein
MVYVYMQFVYISWSANVDNQVNIIIGFQENNIGYVLEVKNEIWNFECGYKWAIEHLQY